MFRYFYRFYDKLKNYGIKREIASGIVVLVVFVAIVLPSLLFILDNFIRVLSKAMNLVYQTIRAPLDILEKPQIKEFLKQLGIDSLSFESIEKEWGDSISHFTEWIVKSFGSTFFWYCGRTFQSLNHFIFALLFVNRWSKIFY